MDAVQRIAKNMTVLLLARAVSMLFGFFYVMYTARYLGPASFGILSFALALNGIFGVIINFGLDPLTVREVARDRNLARKYLANGIVLKLIFGALTFLIVALVVDFLDYPEITRKVVYIITLFTIVNGINNLFNDIYQAFERMEFISVGQILQSVLSLVFAIIAIKFGLSVVYFAIIYLVVNLVVLGYHVAVTTWKFLKPNIEVDSSFWKSIVREAWPFALSAVFISIYYWMDSVMLSYMKGDEVVGWYNAAYRIVLLPSFVHIIFLNSIYPIMSRSYNTSVNSVEVAYQKSFKYLTIIAFPIGIGTTLLSKDMILLIYGNDYFPAVSALRILIWAEVLVFLNVVFGTLLNSINMQKVVTKQTAIGAGLNIVLNLLLIPLYSYVGAAIATVATELFAFIFLYENTKRVGYWILKDNRNRAYILKIGMSSLIFGMFMLFLKTLFYKTSLANLVVILLVSLTMYLCLIYISGVLENDDKKIIIALLRGK